MAVVGVDGDASFLRRAGERVGGAEEDCGREFADFPAGRAMSHSAAKWLSGGVADVADADGVFVDAEKDEVVSERHHTPIPGERVSRESLWQEIQRLARIEQPVEVAIRRFAAPGFFDDVVADFGQIARAPWGVLDAESHARPSCRRTSAPLIASLRANSASASASAARISETSSREKRDATISARPA